MPKKKPEPKEIERHVFIENLRTQIEMATKSIEMMNQQIKNYGDLFLKTEYDKNIYNLKYFVVGDGLMYKRDSRKKMGFE